MNFEVSEVYIFNLNGKIQALECISRSQERIKYETKTSYEFKDLLSGIKYTGQYLKVLNPITYYMTDEEKKNRRELEEYKKYAIYARAIKYEQEKLKKNEIDEIMKQDDEIKKILKF